MAVIIVSIPRIHLDLTIQTKRASLCLVTELVNDLGGRTDERDARLLDLARELCILGKETVSVNEKDRSIRL